MNNNNIFIIHGKPYMISRIEIRSTGGGLGWSQRPGTAEIHLLEVISATATHMADAQWLTPQQELPRNDTQNLLPDYSESQSSDL